MRKYVILLVMLSVVYTIALTDPLLVVSYYTPSNSEDINDTDSGGYRYFVLKEPNIALKLGIRANEVYKNDYINGAFQIRAYHELGAHYDKGYNEYYDVIYQNDNFSVKLFDPKTMEIPLNIKIKDYPFAKIRVFYRNFEYSDRVVFEEVDYDKSSNVVITDSRENYKKHMQKIREAQEKERMKNSTINQQTIPDNHIKPYLGYASVVDTLRIRETPSLQGKIIGSLKRFQTAEWLREESKNTDTVVVNGQPVEERWVKVRTLDGAVTGWVWKGFVRQVKKVIVKEMGIAFYEMPDASYSKDDWITKDELFYKGTVGTNKSCVFFGLNKDEPFTVKLPNEDVMKYIDEKQYSVTAVINNTDRVVVPMFIGVLDTHADSLLPIATVIAYRYGTSKISLFVVNDKSSFTIEYYMNPILIIETAPKYFRSMKKISKQDYETLLKNTPNEEDVQLLRQYIQPDRNPANTITYGHKDFYTLVKVLWGKGSFVDWEGKSRFLSDLQSGIAPDELQRKYDDIMIIKNSIEKVRE